MTNLNNSKIAFVGCGNVANVHMQFLSKLGAKVASVCDLSETRAKVFAEKYRIKSHYSSIDDMLKCEKPLVLHILTPPQTHFEIAIKAIDAGCHLFLEKPLCLKTTEAISIYREAKKRGLKIGVDHTRVYNPMVKKAQLALRNGEYGRIIRVEYDYDDPAIETINGRRTFKKSVPMWVRGLKGGIFTDLLSHPLSVFLSLDSDLELEYVRHIQNEDGITEELLVNLSSDHTLAIAKLSLNIKPLKNILNIFCEKGSIRIDLRNFNSVFLQERNVPSVVGRIFYTLSTILQMTFGFLKGVVGLLAGSVHPYSGLDEILRNFYSELDEKKIRNESSYNVIKVVSLLEQILGKIDDAIVSDKNMVSEDRDSYRDRLSLNAEFLVTGGTGFIGKSLVHQLVSKDKTVRVLCRQNSRLKDLPSNTGLCFGDMRDKSSLQHAVRGVKTIYHCAAAMGGDWAEYYETTVLGTQNLLEIFRESGANKLIFVSSLSVLNYNKIPNKTSVNESAPLEDRSEWRGFYTQAKKSAEDIVRKFAEDNASKTVIVIRPGLVYGRDSNKILENSGLLIGKYLLVLGMGNRFLGLSYVENLAQALVIAGDKKAQNSNIYHVVDPDQPTVVEYIKAYNALTCNHITPIYVPIFIWKAGFRFIDFFIRLKSGKSGTFSYRFASNSRKLDYRADLMISQLNWRPKWDFVSSMEKDFDKGNTGLWENAFNKNSRLS
jgi:predicted dehydrogenase/nucleoside-diphosphate-sugar epimerase